MTSIPSDFGVTTNYEIFFLLDLKFGDSKCHKFNFKNIENNDDKLREFIGMFSYEKLVLKNDKTKLYNATIDEEREFTKEFYKLFHETRLMLIKAFQDKTDVTKGDAIYYTQIFLNRLIFIFFVEDRGYLSDSRLFTNRLLKLIDAGQSTEHSRKIYDEISELFIAFDKGSPQLGVFGFNGGLFSGVIPNKIYFSDLRDPSFFFSNVRQHSKLLKTTKLNENASKIINKYKNQLNPIISNLLILDSFDFNTDVNVNILGHIFEQSISDLEELKNEGISRRKKDGVYYTPEYITDYICRNTIIPYLSKSNKNTTHELIQEYIDDLEELENKFKELKIVDPACGSGAFLNKSIDILLEIHKEIQLVKEFTGEYSTGGQSQLTQWNEESEIRIIVENNIYGVDINRESVEITQLSLFLKLASNNRKLIGLSKNVKVGNSLIDDKTVDEKAFSWQNEFPEVMEFGKFDIVIGNPPYLRIQGLHESHEHITNFIEKNYESATGRYDFYVLFIEKCINLLKKEGYLGFITPHKFTNTIFGKGIRKILSQNKLIHKFLSFGHNFVFKDVTTYTGVLILKNQDNKKLLFHEIEDIGTSDLEIEVGLLKSKDFGEIDQERLGAKPWSLHTGIKADILKKINDSGPDILNFFDKILQGVVTGDDDMYFLKSLKNKGST